MRCETAGLELKALHAAESPRVPQQSARVIGQRAEGAPHGHGAVADPLGEHGAAAPVLPAGGDGKQHAGGEDKARAWPGRGLGPDDCAWTHHQVGYRRGPGCP